jgi:heme-degrading monooxygenase HmoA
MAIGMIFEGRGVSERQYEQVRQEVMPDGEMPDGMLYHLAGPNEDCWNVVEVWESEEQAGRWFESRLGAALDRAGISIRPRTFRVHALIDDGAVKPSPSTRAAKRARQTSSLGR